MEETRKEEEMRGNTQKHWNEAPNFDTRDERSAFGPLQPSPGFFQQQNHALCSQLPSVGLQNSNPLSQMSVFPSRFYYPCYTPSPYSRPMFDPCTSYPALYQSEEFRPKEKRRRCRTVFTQEQLYLLEQGFLQQKYPDGKFRQEMAVKTGLAEDRVQVWFQNRRAKEKRLLEEKLFRENQPENITRLENNMCDSVASAVDESGQMLSNSHQSLQEEHMRKLDNLVTTEVEDSGLANSALGELTAQRLSEGNTDLPDINISAYLTPGPLPGPNVARVESDGSTSNPEVEPSEQRVFLSLEAPISASLESLPRQLFLNTVSTFCQNSTDEEKTVYQGNSTGLMDVFFSEAIHTEGEETVVSQDIEQAESTSETGISSAENNSSEIKYVNLCV